MAEFLVAALQGFMAEYSKLQRAFCLEHPELADMRDSTKRQGWTDFEFLDFWGRLQQVAEFFPTTAQPASWWRSKGEKKPRSLDFGA
jgi:hypothetical protein